MFLHGYDVYIDRKLPRSTTRLYTHKQEVDKQSTLNCVAYSPLEGISS